MNLYWKLLLALWLLVPSVASAAVAKSLKELVKILVEILNMATLTMIALALVIFLYGAVIQTYKAGERGSGVLRTYLLWGIGILFVMVSIWGILRLLQSTLFGGDFFRTGAAETGIGSGSNPY